MELPRKLQLDYLKKKINRKLCHPIESVLCPGTAALLKGKIVRFGAGELLGPKNEVLEAAEAQLAPFALLHISVTHRAAGAHLQDMFLVRSLSHCTDEHGP